MGDYPTAPLPRAGSPEEAGVSSAEVLRFVEDLQKSGIENHSYMVLRGGPVCARPAAPHVFREQNRNGDCRGVCH